MRRCWANPALTRPAAVCLRQRPYRGSTARSSAWHGSERRSSASSHGFVVDPDGRNVEVVGNTVVPQDVIVPQRGDHPPVGGDGRLSRGSAAGQGDPGLRRRGLPQARTSALPRQQPVRLRSARDRLPIERLQEVDRCAGPRAAARAREAYDAFDFRPSSTPTHSHRRHQRLLDACRGSSTRSANLRTAPLGRTTDA